MLYVVVAVTVVVPGVCWWLVSAPHWFAAACLLAHRYSLCFWMVASGLATCRAGPTISCAALTALAAVVALSSYKHPAEIIKVSSRELSAV